MIFIALYLTLLFVAPQLWLGPLIGVRVDLFLYSGWLVYVILTGRLRHFFRFRAQDWFFFGFVLWSALGVAANGMPPKGVETVLYLAGCFLLYRLTVASAADRAGVRRTAHLLVLFGLVLAFEGIQHYWSEDGLGWAGQTLGWVDETAKDVGLGNRTRWIGIFDGPGVFCVVFTIALPFVLQYLASPWGWFSHIAATPVLAVLLLAIYCTGSRGGWITTLVLIGAWVVARNKPSPPKLAALAVLTILFLIAGPRYLTTTRDSSNSAQHRVEMWAEGIEMAQQNPILGIGRGRFAEYTGSLIGHNSAVEIMGEAGLVGLFLWIGISYNGFKNLVYATQQMDDATDREYSRSLLLCVGGYLVSAMFVTLEYETFYFLLALAAVTGDDLDEPPRFGPRDAAVILTLLLTFFVALKAFVMAYFL